MAKTAIHAEDLVKIYANNFKALNGISLSVEDGKTFALVGPNGAGKTTLIRILTTQIRPSSGNAFVEDLNVLTQDDEIRRIISYVPQEISVWTDLSGYENLLIYAKIFGIQKEERKKRIDEVLNKMGLYSVKDEMVRYYSGGMMRRLEIACALLTKPRILFLDEPTIGLDPAARKVVWDELKSFKEEYGITIFFTTHYMDEADMYADEIALINRGELIKKGNPEELKGLIGGEIIQLELDGYDEEILYKIRELDFVNEVFREGNEIRIVTKGKGLELFDFLDFIKRLGIKIKKISLKQVSLDDVFLKYAGSSIEARGRAVEVARVRSRIRKA